MKTPMADHFAETVSPPSTRVLVRGIQLFILLSLVGIAVGIWWKTPAGVAVILAGLKWPFAVLLIPLAGLDYLLGGLRYRLFFNGKILNHISLWNCMRANWANIFVAALTPFQTGGGPAQLYILWRCGAKISDGVLISLVNLLATLIFFATSGIAAVLLLPSDLFGNKFDPIFRTGFIVVAGVTGLILVVLFYPKAGLVMVRQLFRPIPLRSPKFLAFRDRILASLDTEIHHFNDAFREIIRHRKGSLATVVLATMVLYFNKYLMGYVIVRALSQHVPYGIFLGLQVIQQFLIYLAPTPGASGIAELSSLWLMGEVMPQAVLLVYTLVWRFATTILGTVIGGLVLLLDSRIWAKNTSSPSVVKAIQQGPNTTDSSLDEA